MTPAKLYQAAAGLSIGSLQKKKPRSVFNVSFELNCPRHELCHLFFLNGFDIVISYECEKPISLLCENTAYKCLCEHVSM